MLDVEVRMNLRIYSKLIWPIQLRLSLWLYWTATFVGISIVAFTFRTKFLVKKEMEDGKK